MKSSILLIGLLVTGVARAQQTCDRQAGRLLDLLGLHDAQHLLLEENLATYLFNLREPVPETGLASLDAFQDWLQEKEAEYRRRRTFGSNELGRWPGKFYSSIEHPYSDVEAGRHFQRVVQAFKGQCQTLSRSRPGYPRQFFAFGGFVHGRLATHSDLDFFFNDPGGEKGSKQFIVSGLCRGLAFDEASFEQRKQRYLAGDQRVMLGGPVADLGSSRPWIALQSLMRARLVARGLSVRADQAGNWTVSRTGFPSRTFEDPSSEDERNRPL